ncbi:family 20 glycosylhydrolase, partial [Bacteroides sp. OttesenSCG-928-F21]|nr:family 20 glycosylhydrolase [Bacteroides sp. OttesenSCG-928-F21]
CQARIKSLGIKADKDHSAEEKLQSYFVQRIEKFLLKQNKKMIGWDEILEGGLAPTAIVMSWRGEDGGIASANMGHDVIMTPGEWLYLDRYQGDSRLAPVTIGGYLPLEKVYGYDPVPEKIAANKKHHILGAQGNVWNEYNYTGEQMEYDIYPRIIALAELTWTPQERKDYKDFERRIENQRVRLDMYDINYYIPIPEDMGEAPSCNFVAFVDETTVGFETTEPAKIVYTTNGMEPNGKSTLYTEPITISENTTLKVRSILLSGKMSPVREITFEKQTYAPAVERAAEEKPGLKVEYFKGLARATSELEGKTPNEVEYLPTFSSKYIVKDYSEVYPEHFWSTLHTGYINIPEDGVYYFHTDSEFWLDGELFISNVEGNEGTARKFSRSDRSVALAKGYHPFKLLQLGAILGGWPHQWEVARLEMRKANEPSFRMVVASDFE